MLASAALLLSAIPFAAPGGPGIATTPDLRGLPPMQRCKDSERVKLGEKLFRDTRLSADGRVSCATCHQPERAFTDGRSVAQGIGGRLGTRNTPSLVNASFHETFSWEGRRASLEGQVGDAFVHSREHGLPGHDALLGLIRGDASYRSAFDTVFRKSSPADAISLEHVTEAIACFIRSLATGDSAFDRYEYKGDRSALTEPQRRGLRVFRDKGCAGCHLMGEKSASFTDNAFHSARVEPSVVRRLPALSSAVTETPPERVGELILSRPEVAALGRFVVTRDPRDIGRFRTPSLRNVALTPPYLHDGSETTLAGVVEREAYYRSQGAGRPMSLTPSERDDVVAFLNALTSSTYVSPSRQQVARAPQGRGDR